jgi:hypothetical protein
MIDTLRSSNIHLIEVQNEAGQQEILGLWHGISFPSKFHAKYLISNQMLSFAVVNYKHCKTESPEAILALFASQAKILCLKHEY